MAGEPSWRRRAWVRSRECRHLCMVISELGRQRGPSASSCPPLQLLAQFLRPSPLLLAASCQGGGDCTCSGETESRVFALTGCPLELVGELPLPGRPPLGLACADAGKAFSVWGDDGRLRRFAAGSGALLADARSPLLEQRCPRAVAFAPCGDGFAAGCKGFRLLAAEAHSEVAQFQLRVDFTILSLAYSPDGCKLAVGCDGSLMCFDAGTGDLLSMLYTPMLTLGTSGGSREIVGILSVAFAPDGNSIAFGDTNGLLHFAAGADLVKERDSIHVCPQGCVACASALAFTPDGASLAVGCTDGWVRVRGLHGASFGVVLAELLLCPEGRVAALAYEPPDEAPRRQDEGEPLGTAAGSI
mmetsp:Transcript_86812/g.230665  ORF Transcript_86812/g.230665 Transcript_86812/m.230665 type:complete len:358 (-) Transcript_86812:59-1132(-)